MFRSIPPFRLWLSFALVFFISARLLAGLAPRAPLPLFTETVMKSYASLDLSLVLMGLRRFGGDLAFAQLLQYYSSGDMDQSTGFLDGRIADFPHLLEHSQRISSLSPFMHYAKLFGAGALAFNLNRPKEALELLRRGIQLDPSFWRYRLYAGAIAYRQKAENQKVIDLLEEAIRYPDCPSMIKNVLANIHKSLGNHRRAAEIFFDIATNSRDNTYVERAQKNLIELSRRHGIVLR